MLDFLLDSTGLSNNLIGLFTAFQNAKSNHEQTNTRREIGHLMTFHTKSVSSAQELWEDHFKQNTELAQQFDQAATLPEYTAVFQKLGFIEATSPTTKQEKILQTLEQTHIDQASPIDRITQGKLDEVNRKLELLPDTNKQTKEAIQTAQTRYFRSLPDPELQPLPWQERPEIDQALQFLREPHGKQVLLLTGDAGMGKSEITGKITQQSIQEQWLVFPLRLDMVKPVDSAHELGQNLGFPSSPVDALAKAAQGKPCLLVIDQLDAISLASGRDPQFFSVVDEMLQAASCIPNLRVLLACREFDLKHDDRFQRLIKAREPIAQQLSLSPLTTDQVHQVLKQKELDSDRLTDQQLKLLQNPLHLNLFLINDPNEVFCFGFHSLTDLYNLFWKEKQRLFSSEPHNFNLMEVLSPLIERMNKTMALSLSKTTLDRIPKESEILLSHGILREEGNMVAFFHESFFDYVYARSFLSSEQELLDFLTADEQHLFRRAQVRQVLTMLRQEDKPRYLKTLDDLIHSPDIRFHIKELILGLLVNWPDPSNEEWEILKQCLQSPDPDIMYLCQGFSHSTGWSKYLLDSGLLKTFFESDKEDEQRFANYALQRLIQIHPDDFSDFVTPYLETSVSSDIHQRITKSFISDTYTFPIFNIIKRLYQLDAIKNETFWRLLYQISRTQPKWAIDGILLFLQRQINHPIPQSEWRTILSLSKKVIPDEWYADETLKKCMATHPQSFVQHVLPKMLLLSATYANPQSNQILIQDHLWHYAYDFGTDIRKTAKHFLINMFEALSLLTPEQFAQYQPLLQKNPLVLAQYLLIKGYTAHPNDFADQAIDDLCNLRERLFLYEKGSKLQLSIKLLQAITPHASSRALRKLEQNIMSYKPKPKRLRQKELAEYTFLTNITPDRRSAEAQNRINELARKFPSYDPTLPDRHCWEHTPDSPISADACKKMTDGQWLSAMQKYNDPHKRQYHQDGQVIGGAEQLAWMLGARAKEEPERFARFALSLPDDIAADYLEQLIIDLAQTGLDPALTLQVIKRFHRIPNQPYGDSILNLFTRKPEVDWPNEALQIVADYALNHPDPKTDTWINNDDWDGFYAGLHSIRGHAAKTIDQLLEAKPTRFHFFRPTLEKMIYDPIIAVRSCIAAPVSRVLNIDPELALEWFLQLADTHDEFLRSPHTRIFIEQACDQHFTVIRPIIERMLQSEDEEIAQEGARLACLSALHHAEAEDLAQQARTGSLPQRLGAVRVYCLNLHHHFAKEQCEQHLPSFFDDPDPTVRGQAGRFIFQFKPKDFNKHQVLVETLMNSQTYREDPVFLLEALKNSAMRLPNVLLDSAEAYMNANASPHQAQSQQSLLHIQDFGTLLFSLHTQHLNRPSPDSDILERCLDLIDNMARWRVPEYQKGMQDLDRA